MPVAVRRMDGTRRVPTATLGLDVEEKTRFAGWGQGELGSRKISLDDLSTV